MRCPSQDWDDYCRAEEASNLANYEGELKARLKSEWPESSGDERRNGDLMPGGRWECPEIVGGDDISVTVRISGDVSFCYPMDGPDADLAHEIVCGLPCDAGTVDVDEDGWHWGYTEDITVLCEDHMEDTAADIIGEAQKIIETVSAEWKLASEAFDGLHSVYEE